MVRRRMKNKWKIAFWICLILLIVTSSIGFYSVVDQAVTLTYMKEGYSDTEADLETIIQLIEQADQSKQAIHKVLKEHRLYEYMDFERDTIELERVSLIFENDSLKSIEKQW
jgi:biopolymer transport protein ExbB/TolQ